MLFGLFLAAIVNPVVMGVIFFGIGAARFGEIHLVKKNHLQALLMFIGFGYIAFGLDW